MSKKRTVAPPKPGVDVPDLAAAAAVAAATGAVPSQVVEWMVQTLNAMHERAVRREWEKAEDHARYVEYMKSAAQAESLRIASVFQKLLEAGEKDRAEMDAVKAENQLLRAENARLKG